MGTRVITTHLPDEIEEKLAKAAKTMDRSKAGVVKQALSEWLERNKVKLGDDGANHGK